MMGLVPVVTDGQLVTGPEPASSEEAAHETAESYLTPRSGPIITLRSATLCSTVPSVKTGSEPKCVLIGKVLYWQTRRESSTSQSCGTYARRPCPRKTLEVPEPRTALVQNFASRLAFRNCLKKSFRDCSADSGSVLKPAAQAPVQMSGWNHWCDNRSESK